jgi:hypothetical protein
VENRIVKTFAEELDQRMQSTCQATAIILLVLDVLLSDKIVLRALKLKAQKRLSRSSNP